MGTVLDYEENPVSGVNVSVENTDRWFMADADGKFIIMAREKDTLKVVSVGYLPQNISAESTNLIVIMQQDNKSLQDVPPPFTPSRHKVALPDVTVITKKDVENAGRPEYDFRKNAEKNIFIIFIPGSELSEFNGIDTEYQRKYQVQYSIPGSKTRDYIARCNSLTFKHLNKVYGKVWKNAIRKDAAGLKT